MIELPPRKKPHLKLVKPNNEPKPELPNDPLPIVDTPIPIPKDEIEQGILRAVEEVNKTYQLVTIGGKVKIMYQEVTHDLGHKRYTPRFLGERDFKLLFANKTVKVRDGKGKITDAPLANVWLSHEKRMGYEGIGLYPPGIDTPEGRYNLWSGFGVKVTRPTNTTLAIAARAFRESTCK